MSETLLHLARPKTTNFTHGEPGSPRPTTLQKKLFVPHAKFVKISQLFESNKKGLSSLDLLMSERRRGLP